MKSSGSGLFAPNQPGTDQPLSEPAGAFSALAVGHDPGPGLSPQDSQLFRSFQANLLSLISHELRTPLTGILNALSVLDELEQGAADSVTASSTDVLSNPGIPRSELITMARQNAQRLHRSLVMLLDLARLESGTFHARMKEVDLSRIVRRGVQDHRAVFQDRSLIVEAQDLTETLALGDPQKLGRALDLCLDAVVFRAREGSRVEVATTTRPERCIAISFELAVEGAGAWELAWKHGLTGFESGVGSPSSPFAGVLQSEQAFLTRTEEGLGSEFLLIHEILRQHDGKFLQAREGQKIRLTLSLPEVTSASALRTVLSSRAYQVDSSPGAVAMLLIRVPQGRELDEFARQLRASLYRTTDGSYPLPDRNEVAVVLDDYRKGDLPKLLARLEATLGTRLEAGSAHSPDDDSDPARLVEVAQQRLDQAWPVTKE